jgi:hypothetical protein
VSKRAKIWIFRTGPVVTLVGVKPTDEIGVFSKVSGQYELVTRSIVCKIDQVHGALKRRKKTNKEACGSSKRYQGICPPSCNGGRPCAACRATWEKEQGSK